MKKAFAIMAVTVLTITAFTFIKSSSWKVASGFAIKISSKDPNGEFNDLTGTIKFDPADLIHSSFQLRIAVDSIDTGNKLKNKHAKGEHWFDSKNYPFVTFVSKEIKQTDEGFQVSGMLEMHGIKKSLVIPFEFEETGNGGIFTSSFTVNRNDFKLGKPGGKVSDEIVVMVRVPVEKG